MAVAILTISYQGTYAQKVNSTEIKQPRLSKENNGELIELISQMTKNHNQYRSKSSEIYKRYGYDSKQMIENEQFILEADYQNLNEARTILEKYGFPTISMVGPEKAHEYWVIVQACDMDIDFQLLALKKMDKLLADEEVSNRDYAYLSDRVRVNLGLKQFYGTQVRYNEKSRTYEPYELNKPEDLDKRREEMQLEPMLAYLKAMDEKYEGSLKRNKKAKRLKKKP